MQSVRSFLFTSLLLAVPAGAAFAQGAPSAPTTKATAQPTAAPAPDAPPAHEILTEVDAAMNEKAQALFKEGNAHFKAAQYAKAHASYTAAWGLDVRNAKIINNLGTAELELRLYRDAAEHLAIAARLTDASDPKRQRTLSNLAEARAKVGTLNLTIKHGGQELDGVELVDMETGKSYTTPLLDPIFVDPKKVSFRIRREGYESQEKVFELKAGEEQAAEIVLDRPAGYAGGPVGTSTAPAGPAVAPRSKLPGFIGLGVGGAALVAGGVLVGLAAGQQSAIVNDAPKEGGKPLCGRAAQPGEDAACADLRSRAGSASGMGNAGIGVLIGGGVIVAAAAVYLLLPSGKTPANSKTSQIAPVVGQDGGGFVWTGSF